MFLLGLAIAAVIAAFVASDASKRGMSAGGWFFGVFLLLIVFLPAYFIVRKPLLPQYQPQTRLSISSNSAFRCTRMNPRCRAMEEAIGNPPEAIAFTASSRAVAPSSEIFRCFGLSWS